MRIVLSFIFYLLLHFNLSAQNIHRTACQGDLVRLDSMLTGESIDVKDNRGRSLLHWAVACNQKKVIDFLIKKGININAKDNQDKTAMHMAVQYNKEDYFDALIELQTNDNWKNDYGASMLEQAVLLKSMKWVDKLVGHEIDLNQVNNRGSTPLEISQRLGANEISEILLSNGANKNLVRDFIMEGDYMGQEKPGLKPKMFAPNFISTEEQEFGSIFNAKGTEFYFGVDVFGKNEIRYSKMIGNEWTKPVTILSHEVYGYNDPFLSNDEQRLYYISKRAIDGKGELKDVDIWYSERTNDGWSEPINAGLNINSEGNEYYISFTQEGTLYFSTNGRGDESLEDSDHDIFFANNFEGEFQKAQKLSDRVNTSAYEADVFVAPDESYLIFCSTREGGMGRGDLYISFRDADGKWSEAVNMGKEINSADYEYCPFVSKDGKFLFYTSNQDIYWVSTTVIEEFKDKELTGH